MPTWYCQLMDVELGTVSSEPFSAAWSPDKDFVTPESVAAACAAQVSVQAKRRFTGVSAILQEDDRNAP